MRASLGKDAGEMFDRPDTNAWYPVSLMKEFYGAVDRLYSEKDPGILVKMGRFVAEESSRGFLRYLTRLISVSTLVSRIGAFWKHYHKGGGIDAQMLAESEGRKRGRVTVYGYPTGKGGRSAMQGYIEVMIEIAGGRSLECSVEGDRDNGEDTFSWILSWN